MHNAPCLSLKILHNLCFSFLLGIAVVPREIEDNVYAKFLGGWGQTRCARIVGDLQMTNKYFTGEDDGSIEPTLPRSELV